MANPNNAIGTNSAYKGRTSANAFNDDLSVYSRGIMSGWACAPNSGMSVVLGGDGTTRDVAVAEDNAGNKTTVNNISGAPVVLNVGSAPASNSRIDAIVAYVDNPPQGSANIADNYEACGLIAVQGTASSSPIKPTDGIIRTAITADGASGSTAYYVVLAYVTIQAGTTDLTADNITAGDNAMIQTRNIAYDLKNVKLPTASVTDTPFGYGYTANLLRIGNIVLMSSWQAFRQNVSDGSELTEKIPEGYRPTNTFFVARTYVDGSSFRSVSWRIRPNGSMQIFGNAAANDTCLLYQVWVTNDDFPTD